MDELRDAIRTALKSCARDAEIPNEGYLMIVAHAGLMADAVIRVLAGTPLSVTGQGLSMSVAWRDAPVAMASASSRWR